MLKKSLSVLLSVVVLLSVFSNLLFTVSAVETEIVEGAAELDLAETGYTIAGNGTGGLYIDINSDPYAYYSRKSYGQYAYGPSGCAWFASARACQITGKDSPIFAGNTWYNFQYANYGYTRGQTIRAKSLVCYDNHVAVIEAVDGNSVLLSEGGNTYYGNNGYCVIRYTTISQVQSSGFLGYVYLGVGSGGKYGLDYGNDFYALICTRNSSVYVGQSDSDNAVLVNSTSMEKCVFHFSKINSNNGYVIRSAYNNKVLDVDGAHDANETNVQFYPYHEHPAQVWYFQGRGEWVSMTAGCTDRVLDAYGSNVSVGTNLQMYDWNGTSGQQYNIWKMSDTEKVGRYYGDEFYAMIRNNGSLKPIGRSDNDNIELMTEKSDNYDRTVWRFTRLNNLNAYRISNLNGDLYMDVDGANDVDGTNIQCYRYHDHPAQEWYIQYRKDALAIVAGCTSRYLDITGAKTEDGANVETWTYHGTNNAQKFSLDIISENEIVDYAISSNKERFDSGESVNLTVSGSLPYVYNYKFHIVKPDGTESVIDNNCNSALIYQPDADGDYFVYAEVKNPYHTDIGMSSDKAVIFTVGEEPTVPPTEGRKAYLGDADGDGEVTSVDATYIQRYNAMLKTGIDEETLMNADVDGNGLLEIIDATFIQRHLAHMETPYRIAQLIE